MTARIRLNEKKAILILILFASLSIYSLMTEDRISFLSLPDFWKDMQIVVPNDFTAAVAKVTDSPIMAKNKLTRILLGFQ